MIDKGMARLERKKATLAITFDSYFFGKLKVYLSTNSTQKKGETKVVFEFNKIAAAYKNC